jgi:hypothetical protein
MIAGIGPDCPLRLDALGSLCSQSTTMKISELNLPAFAHLKISRTESGRYVGETVEVKSVTISFTNGNPTECHFAVEVSSGAVIEVGLEDVEIAK